MNEIEFLEKHIFTGLKNLNDGYDTELLNHFSESDFQIVLERVEHFGIGIYEIKPWLKDADFESKSNEDFRKKATDAKWYKRAFFEFKKKQADLQYSASYKVSDKLLKKEIK